MLAVLGGALVKMTGAILIVYFLFFTYFVSVYKNSMTKIDSFYFVAIVAIALVIATHWYVLTTFYWKDWPALSGYNSIQDARIWIRPYLQLILFSSTFGWVFPILAVLGALSSKKHWDF